MWMNFGTLPSSSRVKYVIQINFNLYTVHEGIEVVIMSTMSVRGK